MELKNNTPNYIEKKEDSNDNLKDELERVLEKELEKSPDEINAKIISSIVQLLTEMDRKEDESFTDKEEFAKKYLQDYIKEHKTMKTYKFAESKIRFASAIFIFVFVSCLCNCVSVKATNHGILTNIKERAGIFYYEIMKKAVPETDEYEKFSDIQENTELSDMKYVSWEDVKTATKSEFRIPEYIPKKFTGESIHCQIVEGTEFIVSRSYYCEDKYIRIFIKSFSDNGKWSMAVDDLGKVLYEKTIGDVFVSCYQIEEDTQAIFQEDIFIYEIETNLDELEIEKIILNMR